MNLFAVLLAVGLLGQATGKGGESAPAEAKPDAEMVALFDGTDLEGWHQPLDNAAEWSVTKGILEGRGGGPGQPAVLETDRQDFADYRLRVVFGFSTPGGGGVEVRRSGQGDFISCYAVIYNAGPYWGAKEHPPGNVTRLRNYRYGAKWPPARPSGRINLGINRWHTLDIVVVGNKVTTYINGRKADEYTDLRPADGTGGIALVVRGDSVLRVKSVEIEDIPAE